MNFGIFTIVQTWVVVHLRLYCGIITQLSNDMSIFVSKAPYFENVLYITRGVSHRGLAIDIENYLKVKEDLWKLKYFNMQKYNLQLKTSKRNQNPSRYYNSTTNLKFQHKSKYHVSKTLL